MTCSAKSCPVVSSATCLYVSIAVTVDVLELIYQEHIMKEGKGRGKEHEAPTHLIKIS